MQSKKTLISTNTLKLLTSGLLISFCIELSAQNDTVPNYYQDSTGKLYMATGTMANIYVGLTPDGSKSIKLIGNNGNKPIRWDGHGLKHLTRYSSKLGRYISLDIFADALPPKSTITYNTKNGVQKQDGIYLSGNNIIALNAIDPDAGLRGIFYSLNDGANIKYTEPFTLKSEGEYKLSIFAIDNVGNKENETIKTIIVDNTPPLTHLDFSGDKYENIISGRTTLTFSSVDALGVKHTYYSIDSSKIIPYTKPINAASLSEGEHTIKWFSVDDVENTETIKSFTLYVDKTPPMVFEEVAGNTYMVAGKEYSSGRSQLKIAAVDNKSGVKEINYSLNGSRYIVYEKPVYLSDIMGTLSVNSYAVDNVGNRSISDIQTQSFTVPTVDITGPSISYGFSGPKVEIRDTVWIGPKTKIAVNSYDIGAGLNRVVCRVKGEEEKVYTEPFSFDKQGKQGLVCSAYDNVDNVNLINLTFGVDNQGPTIYHHFSVEPISWITENNEKIPVFAKGVKLFLAATDNIAGVDKITYSVNGAKELVYTSTVDWLKPKTEYAIIIKASDTLGNLTESTIRFKIE